MLGLSISASPRLIVAPLAHSTILGSVAGMAVAPADRRRADKGPPTTRQAATTRVNQTTKLRIISFPQESISGQ